MEKNIDRIRFYLIESRAPDCIVEGFLALLSENFKLKTALEWAELERKSLDNAENYAEVTNE